MVSKLVAALGMCALVVAGTTSAIAATDPAVKCASTKRKVAGKKIKSKLSCISKAKAKSVPTDTECLAKAEAKFDDKFTKAGTACPGTSAAIELLVDNCVNTLEADAPGDGKCPSSSAKALGKAGSAELNCAAKELSKPGTFTDCHVKADDKLASSLTKAGNCATGDSQADVDSCETTIANALPTGGTTTTTSLPGSTTSSSTSTTSTTVAGCCGAQRTTLSSSPGTLKVGGFAPFPFPAGVTTVMDAGAPDATCKHPVTLPPGGFAVPPFCIPALQYTSSVQTTGCESGTGIGAGFLWDGHTAAHGGTPLTNVTKNADSADGVCDNVGGLCANRDLNFLGDVDEILGAGGSGTAVTTQLDIPAHSRTWQDSLGCPGDGVYNPADGDTLVTEFDFILSPTTGVATGAFVDKNADGCALPTGSAGFGAASPQCGSGASGPCSASGSPAAGPCCVVGQSTSTATVGEAFSNSFPLYDLGFINVVPSTVSACGAFVANTCVVTSDTCKH